MANKVTLRLGEREGARRLVAEVWRLVENHVIDARSPAADAALDLRDVIDPNWWPVAEDERAACGAGRAHIGSTDDLPDTASDWQP